MKNKEYIEELRKMTLDELSVELQKTRQELEKVQVESGFEAGRKPQERGDLAKKIARQLTILKEKKET